MNYKVSWTTRNGVGEAVVHHGRMIEILPAVVLDNGFEYKSLADRAVIIERNPLFELSGTCFKVIDLANLNIE